MNNSLESFVLQNSSTLIWSQMLKKETYNLIQILIMKPYDFKKLGI